MEGDPEGRFRLLFEVVLDAEGGLWDGGRVLVHDVKHVFAFPSYHLNQPFVKRLFTNVVVERVVFDKRSLILVRDSPHFYDAEDSPDFCPGDRYFSINVRVGPLDKNPGTTVNMTKDDKYTFRGALGNLMRHSLKIVSEESVPGVVTAVHNYRARYDATIEKYETIHRNYFADVFRTYREDILKGYEFDGWLLENDVQVVFGSENPNASHKGYIPLSQIYRASKECVKKAKVKDDQLILYPQIFLLHLYRIFDDIQREDPLSTQDVKDAIHQQTSILENDLKTGSVGESNIRTNKLEFPGGMQNATNPAEALKAMMNDPMLDNIFQMVTQTMAQSGQVPKEELDKVSVSDLRKQFGNILSSDTLTKTFDMMNRTIADAKTPQEVLQRSMGLMNDPKLIEEFAKASASATKEE